MPGTSRTGPGRPAVPDQQIFDGARQALIANPSASMADVARAAGVGMSALYARFASRQALLQHFADDGNVRYEAALDDARARLDQGWTSRRVLDRFMTDLALADIHRIALAVAGTFERTEADLAHSIRLRDIGEALVTRWHDDGVLRPGVTWRDLFKAHEMVAAVQGADPDRTRNLRLRMLDVVLTGLTRGRRPMVGDEPAVDDVAENRAPRAGRP